MRSLLLSICLLTWASAAAAQADPINLDKTKWKITSATLVSGKAYSGTVGITKKGPVHQLSWSTTAGDYQGIGLRYEREFFVGFGPSAAYGLVVYELEGNKLGGLWAADGSTSLGREQVVGAVPASLEGTFQIKGGSNTMMTANAYTGSVTIRKEGERYRIDWKTTAGNYSGIAIRRGKYLACCYTTTTQPNFGMVAYQLSTDGKSMAGTWTTGSTIKLFPENLAKQ
jgi:hypothetical protein